MAPANAPRPGRALAVVALLVIGLYAGVAFGGTQTPSLGLDLRGGTQAILTATAPHGQKVTKDALSKAVDIIRQRVNGAGVAEAAVSTQGNDHIVVAVPGAGRDEVVNRIGKTAQLRFRQVLQSTVGAPLAQNPSPAPTASLSVPPTPQPTATAKSSASPSSTAHPRALSKALLAAGSATPTPSASASGSASPGASGTPTPAPTAEPGVRPNAKMSPQELFATVDCSRRADRELIQSLDEPNQQIVACSQDNTQKYLLDVAKVLGTEVKSADASLQQGGWQVDLSFNGKGTKDWADLTQKAFNAGSGSPQNQVAIVLDGVVVSAPRIIEPIPGGNAQITGSFSESEAKDLANVLKYGALPLKFDVTETQTVSPTLGSDQLRGGLIAGAIGLGLVILYSFLYYRALGLVVIASLALSGLILYAAVTVLGAAINYTLSLAGIAGFIVAVGITADSFVVFFERIRDEIREGRSASARSAVERAWPKARRTILSADTVSLLAAVILYLLSVGSVRGFAFTLGLSTLSDLFIVFLFTKPMLSLIVNSKVFHPESKWSGLSAGRMGGVLRQPPLRAGRRTAEKEA